MARCTRSCMPGHATDSTDERLTHWLSMGCIIAFAHMGGLSRALDRQLQAHVSPWWDGMWARCLRASRTLVTRVLVNCGWLLHRMRSDGKVALLLPELLAHLRLDEKVVVQP